MLPGTARLIRIEHLLARRLLHPLYLSSPGNEVDGVCYWIGTYTQLTLPQGRFARFSPGADIDGDTQGEFHKMTVGISF